jgi:hypothetical protein
MPGKVEEISVMRRVSFEASSAAWELVTSNVRLAV